MCQQDFKAITAPEGQKARTDRADAVRAAGLVWAALGSAAHGRRNIN
jgi:hypothetical protein